MHSASASCLLVLSTHRGSVSCLSLLTPHLGFSVHIPDRRLAAHGIALYQWSMNHSLTPLKDPGKDFQEQSMVLAASDLLFPHILSQGALAGRIQESMLN